jgi:L-serine/L-threonine ammonia-lyase
MAEAIDNLAMKPLSSSNTKIKTPTKPVYKPQKPWIETPLIESAILSKKAGWYVPLPPFEAIQYPERD